MTPFRNRLTPLTRRMAEDRVCNSYLIAGVLCAIGFAVIRSGSVLGERQMRIYQSKPEASVLKLRCFGPGGTSDNSPVIYHGVGCNPSMP